MSLKRPAYPSSSAFDIIQDGLATDEKARNQGIKDTAAIFSFVLKNDEGKTEAWYIDLKETGTVGKDKAPAGKQPTVTILLSDKDFGDLVEGKAKAQSLFMRGRIKVRGNMMKAIKLDGILSAARPANVKL